MEEKESKNIENQTAERDAKRTIIIAVVILGIIAVCGYYFVNLTGREFKTGTGSVSNPVKADYAIVNNDLSDFDLYFLKLENTDNKNIIYSPLSIKYALEMLSEGAKGDTKTQIDTILGGYKAGKYTNSKNMSLANALFIRDSFKGQINDTYIATLQSKYNAEVKYDAFSNAKTINNWVSDKTFKIIKEIVDDADVKDLSFALVNALAIDMEWANKLSGYLDVEYLHERVGEDEYDYEMAIYPLEAAGFHALDFDNLNASVESIDLGAVGNKYNIIKELGEDNIRKTLGDAYDKWLVGDGVEICSYEECEDKQTVVNNFIGHLAANYGQYEESTDFAFYDDNDVKVFAKDLKKYNGTTLQYIGIMPKNISLTKYIESLKAEDLNKIIKSIKEASLENFEEGYITSVRGYIPTFKYAYSLALKDDLKSLGITAAFDKDKADLSNIMDEAYIISAKHKADIEFSNEGIKAAAATEVGGLGNAKGPGFEYLFDVPYKEIDLTFDKPYMYIVRNKDTGEVWFAGSVYDPNHYSSQFD